MTTRPRAVQHPVTQDMPLPGHYPCLTLQLNVTRYHPAGTLRWTCVIREPNLGIETSRHVQETTVESAETDADLLDELSQALVNMMWLQTGTAKG